MSIQNYYSSDDEQETGYDFDDNGNTSILPSSSEQISGIAHQNVVSLANPIMNYLQQNMGNSEFNSILDELKAKISAEKEERFSKAGVVSEEAYQAKQAKIANYKTEAEEKYLDDPKNIQKRKHIDQLFIIAHKGELTEQENSVINQHWQKNDFSPSNNKEIILQREGSSNQIVTGEALNKIFSGAGDAMQNLFQGAMQAVESGKNISTVNALNSLFNSFEKDFSPLFEGEYESLILKPQMESAINAEKKKVLRNKAERNSEILTRLENWWNKFYDDHIETAQNEANEAKEELEESLSKYPEELKTKIYTIVDEELATNPFGSSTNLLSTIRKKIEDVGNCPFSLSYSMYQLISSTQDANETRHNKEKNVKETMKDEQEKLRMENPDDLLENISTETFFDKAVLQLYELDGLGKNLFGVSDEEINMDLDAIDPQDYFIQRLVTIDQKKIEILKETIELQQKITEME